MSNGTTIEEIKEDLDRVFEDFYVGLHNVANQLRAGGSPDDIATDIENLILEFCKHWPTCAEEHNLQPTKY